MNCLFLSFVGFLTALLQNHARKTGISVDTLRYQFQIGSNRWIDPGNGLELSLEQLCFTVIMHASFKRSCSFFGILFVTYL